MSNHKARTLQKYDVYYVIGSNTKVRVITPELYAKLLEIKAEREPKVDAEIVDIQDRMSKLQEELSSLQSEKTAISSK